MKRSPRVLAKRARLLGLPLAGVAMLAALPTAGQSATPRHIPGAGNGLQITTDGPDLRSVSISDLSSGSVQYCFDSVIGNPGAANNYYLITYDSNRYMRPSSVKIAASNAQCVLATYPTSLDIQQATVGATAGGAAADSAGRGSVPSSEPLGQSSPPAPSAGGTNGPDLTGVTANIDSGYIDYNFDEAIDPALSPGAAADSGNQLVASNFHYINDQGDVANGQTAARQGSATVRVTFAGAVTAARRVYVDPAAVRDVPQTGTFADTPASIATNGGAAAANTTPNGTDAAGISGQSTGLPELQSVSGGPQQVTLTYNKDINKGTAASIIAVVDDGRVFTGQSITETSGSSNKLDVTFAAGIGDDPGSVVRIVDKGGAATTRGGTPVQPSAPSRVNVNTVNNAPGFTDAPDLLQVATDAAANTQTYRFDESVTAAAAGRFNAISSSGSGATAGGTPVLGGAIVKVAIPSSASGAVGGASEQGASVDSLGHQSPQSSIANQTEAIPGTPGTNPTMPGTNPTTPTAAVTKYTTKVTIKRRTKSKYKYSGRITSSGKGCKSTRKVVLRIKGKGTKSYGTTKTRSDGTYTIKRRKRLAGKKIYTAVAERAGKKYPTAFCRYGKSKTIKG